jgi:ribosomal protein L21E
MVKRSKGTLSGRTRKLRGKGRVTVAQAVSTFNVGDKVVITPKAQRSGLPHMRYANRHGTVVEKRGKGYVVEVNDMNTTKKIVVGTVHLQLS